MDRKPQCVIVTGRPGSGKATLSGKLGRELWMPVISRDEIKEGYVNTFGVKHDELPPDANAVATDLFFGIVNQYLAGDISIVIEAAFQHKVWEFRMPDIVKAGMPIFILCSIDGKLATERYLQRGLADPRREYFHGDKRVIDYRERGVISPPSEYVEPHFDLPAIRVSTDGEYVPSIDQIVKQIRSLA
jgi:hypothetical protein